MPSTPDKPRRRRRIRELPARLIGRTPWLRRRYARRILKSIEKARAKNRPLPESLQRIDRQLRQVLPPKRAEVLEQMLEMGGSPDPANLSRAIRRAGGRQERRSGKGAGSRPGMPPGQRRRPG